MIKALKRNTLLAFFSLFFSSLSYAQVNWIVGVETRLDPSSIQAPHAKTVTQFSTLEQAITKLKEVRLAHNGALPSGGVTIRLLPGKHRLSNTIILGRAEGGQKGMPVAFIGPVDKSAVISGGRILEKPTEVGDPTVLERLPLHSRGNVVQFDLPAEGIKEFGSSIRRAWNKTTEVGQLELFFRGKPMTLARWPNKGYADIQAVTIEPSARSSFQLRGANHINLARESSLMATGYWAKDWADETIPVESVNKVTGTIILQSPDPLYGIKAGQRVFLQNALSELDQPGEWYLEKTTGILYFWPPALIREGDVEVSILSSLVVTNGANYVNFSGVTFEMARGDAIAVSGGNDVVVEHCTIRNVGGRAAKVGGQRNKFSDVDVYDIGEGGIVLSGGDRQTLQPAGLSIENSRIRRFNRLARTYRPAIQLAGVGNRAIGNVIEDGTHNAIMFSGNDHLISFNEISHVAQETGDVGAIYTGRDWTARGTEIRNNYLHDIHGKGVEGSRGIYLDDQASGIVVSGNLFVRVDRPIYIGGGRDNLVKNNLLISSTPAIHVDARGIGWQNALTNDFKGVLRSRLSQIPYNRPPYSDRYPNLALILNDGPGEPKYNVIQNNLVIDGQALQLTDGADRWVNSESIIASNAAVLVGGASALHGKKATDFVIQEESPIRNGFSPLPINSMNCASHRWRQLDAGGSPKDCIY